MSLPCAPSISSLPALSNSTTRESSSTDSTPLSTALCTPDDTRAEFLDDVMFPMGSPPAEDDGWRDSFATPKPPPKAFPHESLGEEPTIPKSRSLSRIVAKARLIASKTLSVRKTLRKVHGRSNEALSGSVSLASIASKMPGGWKDEKAYSSGISVAITKEVITDMGTESVEMQVLSHNALLASIPRLRPRHPSLHGLAPLHPAPYFPTRLPIAPQLLLPPLTPKTLLPPLVRLLFFLPWCAAVGGAILLAPAHLELVTFAPGYIRSPRGVRRLAHWADCALHHVGIFLACAVVLAWYCPLAAAPVLARCVYAWQDFRPDAKVPLGEDDRQSLWAVARGVYWEGEEDLVVRVEHGRGMCRAVRFVYRKESGRRSEDSCVSYIIWT
ncbi:hypothetical protein A0H81_06090 [Grifola frondosa]|uniref:Uncharacterized protein n=1 Tax=Grifola frondosa TaxID=5627 RepID=A0A1C7MC17_GRIFR|nr:hypothetical protein A0H81_06090 [Grifola frondosa]